MDVLIDETGPPDRGEAGPSMPPPPLAAAAALAGLAGLAASAGPADHHPRVVTLAEFGAVWRRAPRFAFALDVCRA